MRGRNVVSHLVCSRTPTPVPARQGRWISIHESISLPEQDWLAFHQPESGCRQTCWDEKELKRRNCRKDNGHGKYNAGSHVEHSSVFNAVPYHGSHSCDRG